MDDMHTSTMIKNTTSGHEVDGDAVRKLLSKRSFATLATTSPAGRPHAAGVLYELVDDAIYVNTLRSSRKGRNIAANPHVGIGVAIRRLPVGPPSSIHFQAKAELLATDHPEIRSLVADRHLKSLTGHGELELADGAFVRIPLPRRINTYGLGMSLRKLITDPLSAGGSTTLETER